MPDGEKYGETYGRTKLNLQQAFCKTMLRFQRWLTFMILRWRSHIRLDNVRHDDLRLLSLI